MNSESKSSRQKETKLQRFEYLLGGMGLSFSISESQGDIDPLIDHCHSRSSCAMLGSSLIRN